MSTKSSGSSAHAKSFISSVSAKRSEAFRICRTAKGHLHCPLHAIAVRFKNNIHSLCEWILFFYKHCDLCYKLIFVLVLRRPFDVYMPALTGKFDAVVLCIANEPFPNGRKLFISAVEKGADSLRFRKLDNKLPVTFS